MNKNKYYARYSTDRKQQQLLKDHLTNVSLMTSQNACKIGLKTLGKYLGLIHDLGKYSKEFQDYINSNDKTKRGSVIHSKAGAMFLYEKIKDTDEVSKFLKELLALCCMSHHTNLIDMLDLEGNNNFKKSMDDDSAKVPNFEDNINNIEDEINHELDSIDIKQAKCELENIIKQIEREKETIPKYFYMGMLAKFLLSCLIDADHTNSANFELQEKSDYRQKGKYISWEAISERIEKHLEDLNKTNKSNYKVKIIRKQISADCLKAGQKFEKGCYKLEVPTGGGKTLASFRFAVEMAKRHKLDRIIYCIPYTTIIEQNAETIRKIVEQEESEKGKIVIEHHFNLSLKEREATDEEIDQNEILTENWDAPIIFTTNVRILEVFFGKKTTNTRRLHQLAKSVVIFDEIQTLPIKCVHIFNNVINFLVDICKTTVVLCTATQPLLSEVDKEKGAIKLSDKADIVDNAKKLFDDLARVEIVPKLDRISQSGDIAQKAIEFADKNNNCLVVCNTTKSAKEIFQIIQEYKNQKVYHLSARMCPAHRKSVLEQIFADLDKQRKNQLDKKFVVVSTQVIEAGIDIDFNCGIRALAGLDSITQTAGRINRNGSSKNEKLYVYEFKEELRNMEEMEKGKEASKKIFYENEDNIKCITPKIMKEYYTYYFFNRKDVMDYKIKVNGSLLQYLSVNKINLEEYKRTHGGECPSIFMKQSFKEAAEKFKSIDAPTSSVIVPYDYGQEIISKLCNEKYDFGKIKSLIKESRKYSVNLYSSEIEKFCMDKAIKHVNEKTEILYLEPCYYNENFGITNNPLDTGGVVI
jgi:CRISPR-associated endonuclease/helicase Cas3